MRGSCLIVNTYRQIALSEALFSNQPLPGDVPPCGSQPISNSLPSKEPQPYLQPQQLVVWIAVGPSYKQIRSEHPDLSCHSELELIQFLFWDLSSFLLSTAFREKRGEEDVRVKRQRRKKRGNKRKRRMREGEGRVGRRWGRKEKEKENICTHISYSAGDRNFSFYHIGKASQERCLLLNVSPLDSMLLGLWAFAWNSPPLFKSPPIPVTWFMNASRNKQERTKGTMAWSISIFN